MNAPLTASLIEGGITGGFIALLGLPAFFRGRALMALFAISLSFADEFIQAWGAFGGIPLIHGSWNWNGKLFDLAFLLLVAVVLVASGVFRREDLGLTWKQRPGTLRAVFIVVAVIVVIDLTFLHFAPHESFTTEDLAFQLTMPGFTEELFYRGLLLAVFDRMFPPRVTLLGAKVGYGAIVTSLAFGLVHAFGVSRALHVTFSPVLAVGPLISGFFTAWFRARSGSLVLPILGHNLSNTVVTVAQGW
jgi:membrane protease YdiL (CAAX protease family)